MKIVVIGVLMLIFAVGIPFAYEIFVDYRIPSDWSWQAKYIGSTSYPDGRGGFASGYKLSINKRVQKVLSWSPDKAVISDIFTTTDINTGEIIYQSKERWEIDPKTGQHLQSAGFDSAIGQQFVFPQDAEKKDYRIFNYYIEPLTVKFVREEKIAGLMTYVYRFSGMLDGTASYRGTDEYPGIIPGPGQTIIFSNLLLEYWVEPGTGEVVKSIEESEGDFIINIKDGKRLEPINAWVANMTDDSVHRQIRWLNNYWAKRIYFRVVATSVLAVVGLVFIAVGLFRNRASGTVSGC